MLIAPEEWVAAQNAYRIEKARPHDVTPGRRIRRRRRRGGRTA
ncbi:hypothetical protein CLV56_0728 [Mumia flava]|uniref:Uncharacterized protein n=1 Tax=Mumia flava TaxID=1348852 RepID=A0A2M9BEZ4_9ACTN|nr:hypothetical protein [Mumia flava]PJJ56519.1 hypothetical protein CLV56_0728 [Mumia flava]